MLFRREVGYYPNVALPRRYNEKMFWRKIFDHNPLFVTFSDKLATKDLLAQRCPDLDVAKVLWIGRDASKIPDDVLALPVVIKANHGSDMNVFHGNVGGQEPLPLDQINAWMERPFGEQKFEWAYTHAERKLFVEKFITTRQKGDLFDISVHAVDEQPLFIEVIRDNKTGKEQKGYFRPDGSRWKAIEKVWTGDGRNTALPEGFNIPEIYQEALDHARVLSAGVDYARFDFLSNGDRLYGGEITIYPASGLTPHAPFANYNKYLSEHWDLLKSWFLTSRQSWILQFYVSALRRCLVREMGRD